MKTSKDLIQLAAVTHSSPTASAAPDQTAALGRVLVEVKNVSKRFRFWDDRPTSFKTVLVQLLKGRLEMGSRREFQALSDISFEVRAGEFVGIMGRNGAGKSTLMKILAGIYEPSSGEIKIHDQVAPLIELGAGFHPDLSGYENIYLNAAVLGFGKAATEAAIPAILDFAELGEKIHMPIKNYSSGMLVRLGFAIATHLTAPILLVDELLAVGDYNFQQKCIAKIHELHRAGRTIILITHDPKAVAEHCSRCIVIDQTRVVFDGGAGEGAQAYLSVLRGGSVNQSHEIDRSVLPRKRGTCPVCAGENFVKSKVLWPELIQEWELNPSEVELIDNQQGLCCSGCHSNLRSMTLAEAFLSCVDFAGTFDAFTRSPASKDIKVLEVNEAGSLRPWLARLPGWKPGDYPSVDLTALPYRDGHFDLVVHSDVLQCVSDPALAIRECLRVVKAGGYLCLTIPIVPARLGRSRMGLPPSYHSRSTPALYADLVHTEYGADFFVQFIGAGCSDIRLITLESNDAIALVVKKNEVKAPQL